VRKDQLKFRTIPVEKHKNCYNIQHDPAEPFSGFGPLLSMGSTEFCQDDSGSQGNDQEVPAPGSGIISA